VHDEHRRPRAPVIHITQTHHKPRTSGSLGKHESGQWRTGNALAHTLAPSHPHRTWRVRHTRLGVAAWGEWARAGGRAREDYGWGGQRREDLGVGGQAGAPRLAMATSVRALDRAFHSLNSHSASRRCCLQPVRSGMARA
jgi:hypothetical protein